MQHTTRCIAQSNAPHDGQNCCPKYVELIWIYQETVIVASSWSSSLPSILMMHGQTNIKHNRSIRNDAITLFLLFILYKSLMMD
jgi:hypothetical protein